MITMVMGDRGILIQSLRISSLQIRNTSTPIEDTSYDRTPMMDYHLTNSAN
jgi:hypothetical protein